MRRLHGGINTLRLHNLIKHNYYLMDPWLRRLVLFRHVGSSQKVKLLTTIYAIYQFISEYSYKYIFVKIERSKLSEFSNFQRCNFFF